ncbi:MULTISPECIES: transketolase [unclassified Janthinobacterium]|uniref:transketolase n=1 Tax=unclassified Janthinobacterium TaxID=2610881 RepID=UPI00161929B6|nr:MULTISPECIES: transketolase [unclassified Janthinobacterium]MBB5366709.1 transketolase [Janthinobacterium sp. K2C7]MBB5380813.1 transketolase [Janthinobacterium sp. K2Li3]MBB5385091.1 transketolase [Janthinobacterium sp. K2E3]
MNAPLSASALDQQSVDALRFLAIDTVQQANSGHPGLPLDAAPMAYILWTRLLKHDPDDPQWFDRDRFVLSAGHGSALLYSLLHLTGYALPMEQMRQFRQWGSITPGHPERGLTPGVELTTGPLGQGFANGVGMAMVEAHLAARFNREGHTVIDHYTYALVSDGDLMEGVAAEAASLAGHLQLGKLIYLYDDNNVTLSAGTDMTFSEDRAARFAAYGWHTHTVADGNDLEALEQALRAARAETLRPSLILVRTHLGYGSPKQDSFEAHGSPLGEENVRLTKRKLGWPEEPPFYVPDAVREHFLALGQGGRREHAAWQQRLDDYERAYPELALALRQLMQPGGCALPDGWDAGIPAFPADAKGMATRSASGLVMNGVAAHLPALIGGSADLDPSTYTALKDTGDFQPPALLAPDRQGSNGGDWNYAGRNLHFGVREHAMAAISNGIAAHGGAIPFCATFLIFSDYMRPSIRLAALMELRVVFVFTHDSIALGEDGPTHQPIEQLASLRAIPRLIVIRPADANETAYAWRVALQSREQPVALALTRQHLPTLDRSKYAPAEGLLRGAYVLSGAAGGKAQVLLIASGSEVTLALAVQEALALRKVFASVVSMPSWELFDAQPQDYRDTVLPPALTARLAIEAGVSQGWHRYIGDHGDVIAIDTFGASAPGDVLMQHYGYTVENVCQRAQALLGDQAPAGQGG